MQILMEAACDTKVLDTVACLHKKGHSLELWLVSCNSSKISMYSGAPVSTSNAFQDLPRLHETADNTERYI
jgi:hypothetical protein